MSLFDWLGSLFGRRRPPADPSPPPPPAGDLLSLHNAERRRLGVPELSADPQLTAAARQHAASMAADAWLSHEGFPGRVYASGYPGRTLAENVAAGAGTDAAQAWGLWLASPGHRGNALAPAFRDAGFGSAVSPRDGQTYWCAVYGAKGRAS